MPDDKVPHEPATTGLPDDLLSQLDDPSHKHLADKPEAVIEKPQLGPVVMVGKKSHRRFWVAFGLVVIIILTAVAFYLGRQSTQQVAAPQKMAVTANTTTAASTAQGLQLDTAKNYGNKYATGILPVGDGKYDSATPKVGSVYTCAQYAQNLARDQGGAGSRGPWFTNNNTQYDTNKKLHVQGGVVWQSQFTNVLSANTRTITTNDLPTHTTGIFPIKNSDPAYTYDRNPNTIKGQALSYALPASPAYNATPNCMGGEAGVMLTGVALFNAFDAGGRDAGAWEIQDDCAGHPQKEGEYHYHTLSSCIQDVSVKTIIGYALDGFPITGPSVAPTNILTTSDLDECHGITSDYTLDGKTVTGYHYVMTQDFPYSVSCFRGTAIKPPGQP